MTYMNSVYAEATRVVSTVTMLPYARSVGFNNHGVQYFHYSNFTPYCTNLPLLHTTCSQPDLALPSHDLHSATPLMSLLHILTAPRPTPSQ